VKRIYILYLFFSFFALQSKNRRLSEMKKKRDLIFHSQGRKLMVKGIILTTDKEMSRRRLPSLSLNPPYLTLLVLACFSLLRISGMLDHW